MRDLQDGEIAEIKGSSAKPYVLRNTGGVYSCSCPAWRNQSIAIEARTCKHLRQLRGDAAEAVRIGHAPADPVKKTDRSAPVASSNTLGLQSTAPAKEPPLLLAHPWDQLTDLAGWWMSEKLDGVRAYWDGGRFVSRQGNEYRAPDWFVEGLPKEPLDGELWLDRQMFQRTVGIVRRHDASEHWKEITYVVFDAPALTSPFEHRQLQLQSWLGRDLPYARVLDQHVCQGVDHLHRELERVIGLGGEGLMLRQPQSLYEVGRSTTLFKVKTFLDADATVVQHLPGEGKHVGRLGALVVEMPDGTRFSVGTGFTDAERRSPPPIGALITYRYQELTDRGVPRFPTFLRVRSDLHPPDWCALSSALAPKTPSQAQMPGKSAIKCASAPAAQVAAASSVGPHATKAFKTLCISGRLPSGRKKADFASALSVVGIQLVDEVVEGLDYLVLADSASMSSKAQKARALGVAILSEGDLAGLLMPSGGQGTKHSGDSGST
jgi:DNA ligase-1